MSYHDWARVRYYAGLMQRYGVGRTAGFMCLLGVHIGVALAAARIAGRV